MIVTMFPEPRRAGEGDRRLRVRRLRRRIGRAARRRRADPGDQLALDLLRQHPDRHRDRRASRARLLPQRRGHRPRQGRRHPGRDADHRLADARRLHDRQARRRAGLGRLRRRSRSAPGRWRCWRRSSPARQPRRRRSIPLRIFRSRNISGANVIQALTRRRHVRHVLPGGALPAAGARLRRARDRHRLPACTLFMGLLSLRYSERLIMRFGARTMLFPGLALIARRARPVHAGAPSTGATSSHVLPSMVLLGTRRRGLRSRR